MLRRCISSSGRKFANPYADKGCYSISVLRRDRTLQTAVRSRHPPNRRRRTCGVLTSPLVLILFHGRARGGTRARRVASLFYRGRSLPIVALSRSSYDRRGYPRSARHALRRRMPSCPRLQNAARMRTKVTSNSSSPRTRPHRQWRCSSLSYLTMLSLLCHSGAARSAPAIRFSH